MEVAVHEVELVVQTRLVVQVQPVDLLGGRWSSFSELLVASLLRWWSILCWLRWWMLWGRCCWLFERNCMFEWARWEGWPCCYVIMGDTFYMKLLTFHLIWASAIAPIHASAMLGKWAYASERCRASRGWWAECAGCTVFRPNGYCEHSNKQCARRLTSSKLTLSTTNDLSSKAGQHIWADYVQEFLQALTALRSPNWAIEQMTEHRQWHVHIELLQTLEQSSKIVSALRKWLMMHTQGSMTESHRSIQIEIMSEQVSHSKCWAWLTSSAWNDIECNYIEQDHDILVFDKFKVFSNVWQSAGPSAFGDRDCLRPFLHLMHPQCLHADVPGSPCLWTIPDHVWWGRIGTRDFDLTVSVRHLSNYNGNIPSLLKSFTLRQSILLRSGLGYRILSAWSPLNEFTTILVLIVDSSPLSVQRRHLLGPTVCAWSLEVLELIAVRIPECDVDFDKCVWHGWSEYLDHVLSV